MRSTQPLHPSARQTHTVSTVVVPVAPSEEAGCLSEASITELVGSTLTNPGSESNDDTYSLDRRSLTVHRHDPTEPPCLVSRWVVFQFRLLVLLSTFRTSWLLSCAMAPRGFSSLIRSWPD